MEVPKFDGTYSSIVARAKSAMGKKFVYRLGSGGYDPNLSTPCKVANVSGVDCSGFVAWCIGISRKIYDLEWYKRYNGGWFETTAVYQDAVSRGSGLFVEVEWFAAKPGMIIVYPDSKSSQGHMAIVSETDRVGPLKIIHCSLGNVRKYGSAVKETGLGGYWFERNAIAVRYMRASD